MACFRANLNVRVEWLMKLSPFFRRGLRKVSKPGENLFYLGIEFVSPYEKREKRVRYLEVAINFK